jgi:YidC/Oxa1 family membrane protein insertase
MFQFIATVLAWFYSLIHNYAFAISMLTITVMIVLTPLTLRSTKSMLEMQRIQPEVKRLQNEFKGDRQRLNEEVMKLYKEHKVNPLGGCLPLILQMPVFFVLYQVLRDLTRTCQNATQITEGQCTDVGNFRPDHIGRGTDMFRDLVASNEMLSFGLDLSRTPVEQVREGLGTGAPYLVLILLMAGLSFFAQWQVSLRSKVTGQIINKQQQMIFRVMPVAFALFSLNFPTGLVVYWIVQNLVRIVQNAYIKRRFYGPHGPAAQLAATRADDAKEDKPKAGTSPSSGSADDASVSDAPRNSGKAGPRSGSAQPAPSKGGAARGSAAKGGATKGSASSGGTSKGGPRSGGGTKGGDGEGSRPVPRRSGPSPKARPTPQPRGRSPRREP